MWKKMSEKISEKKKTKSDLKSGPNPTQRGRQIIHDITATEWQKCPYTKNHPLSVPVFPSFNCERNPLQSEKFERNESDDTATMGFSLRKSMHSKIRSPHANSMYHLSCTSFSFNDRNTFIIIFIVIQKFHCCLWLNLLT